MLASHYERITMFRLAAATRPLCRLARVARTTRSTANSSSTSGVQQGAWFFRAAPVSIALATAGALVGGTVYCGGDDAAAGVYRGPSVYGG